MLNVGVIGVGYLGQHHARIFSSIDGVRLFAVVDSNRTRAQEIADRYGCMAFTNYEDILEHVDAVSIVTPTISHYQIAMECIKAGKHLLIEKPITRTIEEADELLKASEDQGVILQVGHLERFNPVVTKMNQIIKTPLFFESERLSPFLGRGADVDITLDLMIHDIDIVMSIINTNSVSHIKASGFKLVTENIDYANAWIEFENGSCGLFTASRISSEKSRKMKIFQDESYIIVDFQNLEIKRFYGKEGGIAQENIKVEPKEPLKEEIEDFVKCINNKTTPLVCGLKGRNALKLALEVGEKIRQGWGVEI